MFDIFHVFIVLMMIGLDEGFGINWLGYVHGRSLSNYFGFFFFGWGGRVVGGMHQGKGLLGSKPCDSIQKDFWIVCNNGLVFSFKRIPFLF